MQAMAKREGDNERGAALVEYVLVLPVFLLLTLGSLEVFRLISVQQSLRTGLAQALPFYTHWRDTNYYTTYCTPQPACLAVKDPSIIIQSELKKNPFARKAGSVSIWPDALTLDNMADGTVFEVVATVEVQLGFLYPLPGGPRITLRESAWTFIDSYPDFYDLAWDVPFPYDPGALPSP